jgi:hypothetical protein
MFTGFALSAPLTNKLSATAGNPYLLTSANMGHLRSLFWNELGICSIVAGVRVTIVTCVTSNVGKDKAYGR